MVQVGRVRREAHGDGLLCGPVGPVGKLGLGMQTAFRALSTECYGTGTMGAGLKLVWTTACVGVFVCGGVCVRECQRVFRCVRGYMSVCVCVCVCVSMCMCVFQAFVFQN